MVKITSILVLERVNVVLSPRVSHSDEYQKCLEDYLFNSRTQKKLVFVYITL